MENTTIRSSFREAIGNAVIGICVLLLLLFVPFVTGKAEAKIVLFGSSSEQIRIKYGSPTIFRFQKPVQTITGASRYDIKPANPSDPNYSTLSVTPRFTNGKTEVSFFLTDNTVVKAQIIVSPSDPAADSHYDFKSRDSADSGDAESAPPITEIELLKAMILDGEVSGYKILRSSDPVPTSTPNVTIDLIRIYKGSPFNGYVFKITNTSWRKNVQIDARHITVGSPNSAILSQSDEAILFPKEKGSYQTLVRIVSKNTSTSRDVIFAMETEEPVQTTNH